MLRSKMVVFSIKVFATIMFMGKIKKQKTKISILNPPPPQKKKTKKTPIIRSGGIKRNNLLQLDAFISVGVIQCNNNTRKNTCLYCHK